MAGDSNHGGSDDSSGAKQNAWLGRGKFASTVKNIHTSVTPSFSIENLSMCSAPNKMQLTGDLSKGEGRWVCK